MELDCLKEKVENHRKELHKIPELGFCEVRTSLYLESQLKQLGYETRTVAKTGMIAFKKGISEECIAFRSDMDGLNVTEETNLSFSSEIEGQMHACGHDGHMACLLGFAEYIASIETLKKGILFIFQPAEEEPGGAKVMLEEGIFDDYPVTNVFGLHLYPELEEGTIGLRPGVMTAQTGEFDVYIKGKSGHGAIPHKANDALIIVAQLINSYQSIISRNLNPIEGSVLTIGSIQGGERRNVIAEKVKLEGTIRAFSQDIYQTIKDRMVTINQGLELMFNAKVEVVFRDKYPCIVNDKDLFNKISQSSIKSQLIELDPMMIAEDFSYYQEKVPGLFFMIGSRNERLGFTHSLHHSKFDFNSDVLINGIKVYDEVCRVLGVY